MTTRKESANRRRHKRLRLHHERCITVFADFTIMFIILRNLRTAGINLVGDTTIYLFRIIFILF